MVNFIAQKISKTKFFDLTIISTRCTRKGSAGEYPKNFALLRLAEKSSAK